MIGSNPRILLTGPCIPLVPSPANGHADQAPRLAAFVLDSATHDPYQQLHKAAQSKRDAELEVTCTTNQHRVHRLALLTTR